MGYTEIRNDTKEYDMKYVIQLIAFAMIFAGCGSSSSSSSSNTPPVAHSQSVTMQMDTNLSITLSGTDIDGNTLTYKVVTPPLSGHLTGTAPNVVYIPDAGYIGSDSFAFKVNDGTVDSAAATVRITVKAVNNVLKTGQTISDVDFDDGFYQKGVARSYTRDDVNETVTDNVTGLMWQDDSEAASITSLWSTAASYCTDLNVSDHTDWRLPTRAELVSISDFGRVGPAIDPTFVNIVAATSYWSATETAGKTTEAWSVSSYYGGEYSNPKTADNFVRCVRVR
jgi:hypothetical protein